MECSYSFLAAVMTRKRANSTPRLSNKEIPRIYSTRTRSNSEGDQWNIGVVDLCNGIGDIVSISGDEDVDM